MNEKRAKLVEIVAGILSGTFGLYYGSVVPFKDQIVIYDILRSTSAIIFGIVGAWYAVLTPMYLSNFVGYGEGKKLARQLLKNLMHPIKYSVYILCITVAFYIAIPFVNLFHLGVEVKLVLKSISFGLVCSLSVLMLFTLMRALIPNDFVKTSIELEEEKDKYISKASKNINKT